MTLSMENPAIQAATVVFYREDEDGPARHLMVVRQAKMSFAAGALVFPGGRVDAGDGEVAANAARVRHAPEDALDAAARVAAIREAIEEVGVAVGVVPALAPQMMAQWRAALKAHRPLGELLAADGRMLDLAVLVPFARWCPKHTGHRNYDTWFYVAKMTGDAVEVDTDEATHHLWLTARAAMEDDTHRIIFPTLRNLERLAEHPRFDAVLAHLAETPVRAITPQVRQRDGVDWLCIPEDAGYPVTGCPLAEMVGP